MAWFRLPVRLAVAAVFATVGPASAQSLVRGTVTDASTGDPLPGATVQVRDTARGAVTNPDGKFELALPGFPVRLRVRYIGYRSAELVLAAAPTAPLAFALEPEVVEMGELVVTDESVAEGIMRRAIARKAVWQDSVRTAYAEVYSRFLLMREFDPVRVEETISALWWEAGAGTREVVRARRTRPSRGEAFRFAGPLPVPDPYDDTVEDSTFDHASCHSGPGFALASEPSGPDDCFTCHESAPVDFVSLTCISCHEHSQQNVDSHHGSVQNYVYDSIACYDCHPRGFAGND